MEELSTCPFCGKPVEIKECGRYKFDGWITVVHTVDFVKDCRVFMESEFFDLNDRQKYGRIKKRLIEKWNRRCDK